MAGLQKRGNYTPRRAREQRAYRLVVTGAVTGTAGAVALVLAIFGVGALTAPAILLLIVAAICVALFRGTVNSR